MSEEQGIEQHSGSSPRETVSVVVPVYNGAAYVSSALDSVLSQSHPPIECIVVDDGSTDGTPQVLSSYGDRVQVLSLSNGGVSRARNAGARVATGRWLSFLDADDLWLPGRLERQLCTLADRSEVSLAYCGLMRVDEMLRPLGRMGVPSAAMALSNTLLLEPPPVSAAQACLVDRDAFWEIGGFDESMSTSADADLVVRLASRYAVSALDEDLVLYRVHPGQMSGDLAAMERDMLRLHEKAFGSDLLPPMLKGSRARARSNLHASLCAELVARRCWREAQRHGRLALLADPARVSELVLKRIIGRMGRRT